MRPGRPRYAARSAGRSPLWVAWKPVWHRGKTVLGDSVRSPVRPLRIRRPSIRLHPPTRSTGGAPRPGLHARARGVVPVHEGRGGAKRTSSRTISTQRTTLTASLLIEPPVAGVDLPSSIPRSRVPDDPCGNPHSCRHRSDGRRRRNTCRTTPDTRTGPAPGPRSSILFLPQPADDAAPVR